MQQLKQGHFFGRTNELFQLPGLTFTDTEYTHDVVDWHEHEHSYFTFLIAGRMKETDKKQTHYCEAGMLLFHNSQDSHYNIKPAGYTRGFHIEVNSSWLEEINMKQPPECGTANLIDPKIKMLMYQIFRETKLNDTAKHIAIASLVVSVFSTINDNRQINERKKPFWVNKIKDLLHDVRIGNGHSLLSMADSVGIHPVHLCRDFPRYFNCSMGEYIRTIRVQNALSLMTDGHKSLTEIAYESGFSDQSHFTRSFKSQYQMTPARYRKLLER